MARPEITSNPLVFDAAATAPSLYRCRGRAILENDLPETMSAASDKGVEPSAVSLLLRRPSAATSVVLDLVAGVIGYFASYWLRFRGSQLAAFLPGAVSTLPFVLWQILTRSRLAPTPGARS